jgi:hypothetical protein
MITKDQMVTALVPYMQSNNPGRSVDEIKSFLRQMTPQDLENTYNHAAPLDPDTEAKIEAQAKLHSDLAIKRLQRDEQYEQQARQKWPETARQLGISNCDVNFNIAVSLHPSVFNVEDMSNMIMTGQLKFIPPTADELAETELIEKNQIVEQVLDSLRGHFVRKVLGYGPQDYDVFGQPTYGERKEANRARNIRALLELPLDTLRRLHQNQEVSRLGQSVNPGQPDANLNSGSGLDRANGNAVLPLPKVNGHGETIDAAYLVRLANVDLDMYKRLIRKHGYKNMTDRIRGIA